MLPRLGGHDIDAITAADLEQVFLDLRRTPLRSTGKVSAPKTVWTTCVALKALYRDAKKKGLVRSDPCILGEEELGPIEDADPEWRKTAIFSRDECG